MHLPPPPPAIYAPGMLVKWACKSVYVHARSEQQIYSRKCYFAHDTSSYRNFVHNT